MDLYILMSCFLVMSMTMKKRRKWPQTIHMTLLMLWVASMMETIMMNMRIMAEMEVIRAIITTIIHNSSNNNINRDIIIIMEVEATIIEIYHRTKAQIITIRAPIKEDKMVGPPLLLDTIMVWMVKIPIVKEDMDSHNIIRVFIRLSICKKSWLICLMMNKVLDTVVKTPTLMKRRAHRETSPRVDWKMWLIFNKLNNMNNEKDKLAYHIL